MTCAEIKDRTIDYLYAELSAGERAAFDQHLAGCDSCRAEVSGLQGTLHQARAAVKMTDEAPPPRVRVAVLEAARAAAGAAALPVAAAARTVPVRSRTESKAESGGFWEWLKRPWFLPLVGATAVVAIFVLVREPVTKPTSMLPTVEKSAAPEPAPAAPQTPTPEVAANDRPVPAAAPPADWKARPAAPARKPALAKAKREAANGLYGVRDGANNEKDSDRFAVPPPSRPTTRADSIDDLLSGVEHRRKEESGAGAGVGHPGGPGAGGVASRSQPAPAEKKQVADLKKQVADLERHRAPSQEAAKVARAPAPVAAPVAMEPSPAAASAPPPPPARASRGRALDEAEGATQLQAETTMDTRPAKGKKADKAAELSPFEQQVRRADRLFSDAHWAEAAAAYRELLRQYPDHKLVAGWKGRVRACDEAIASAVPKEARPPAAAKAARKASPSE